MAKLYPGDRVRPAPSHPFYEDIKNDEMIVIAVEMKPDMSGVKVQTATGTSKGFSNLAWENWKTGWLEDDLELVGSAATTTAAPVTPVTATAKAATKAAEAATAKVANA